MSDPIEALTAQVAALAAVVSKLAGGKADAWDRPNPEADAARDADMAAARAFRLAEIEAHNAEVERRAYWSNLPAEQLAKLEKDAAARRYVEALADVMARKGDPATVAGLAAGLDATAIKAAAAAVAAELDGKDGWTAAATALRALKPR